MIRAVVFDIGETLLSENRYWGEWADWLEVPRTKFFAVLADVIGRREHHRRVFQELRPGLDLQEERRRRAAAGQPERWLKEDLYPDALPALEALKAAGYWLGVAGNQQDWAEQDLHAMNLPVDLIAASARWGLEKPTPEFFARVIREAAVPAHQIAYVGDRLDNDVLPAIEAGMKGIFLRRGPWGLVHAQWPEVVRADAVIDGLDEVPGVLAGS